MKKIYYFSKSKLKFVEVKNFYRKYLFLVAFFSIISGFILFGSYYLIHNLINPDFEVSSLKSRNEVLELKLRTLLAQYKKLDSKIDALKNQDNDLRLAVNLNPISKSDREVGVGGSEFSNIIPSASGSVLKQLDQYTNKISAKINFELNNYKQISTSLKTNKKLYAAIPAIDPMQGRFGDRFGMRMHPILHVRKMHNGLDIIANIGTKVYAPGAGKVSFVGRKSGYGKVVEIDHGFGYVTLYAHLSKQLVKKGQRVKRGDLIALSGNSGRLTTGPHLHYEVRHDGIPLNPRYFMYDDVKLFDIVSNQSTGGKRN